MNLAAAEHALRDLQARLCAMLERHEPRARFLRDEWTRAEGGGGLTAILEGGEALERAGVGFSHVSGTRLPPSASQHRPELAGRAWQAMGVSVVVHPRNPYAPTSHCNVRLFVAERAGEAPVWWFGGGFDLTPYYGFQEDARDWHRAAQAAVGAHYPRFKHACDEYFVLKHRGEPRGIGGIFYDDFTEGGFDAGLALTQRVGHAYLAAYDALLTRRVSMPHGARERDWQLYRRGRYAEFNLVWDRGTLFGLQSGGRTESILMSMPPEVRWSYRHTPAPGSPEARLMTDFLVPRDWI